MVVHICNPKQKNCHEFNANLWYIVRACLKQTNQPNKTKVELRIFTWERGGEASEPEYAVWWVGNQPVFLAFWHIIYIRSILRKFAISPLNLSTSETILLPLSVERTAHRAKTTEKVLRLKDLKFKYSPPQASAVLTSPSQYCWEAMRTNLGKV